MTDAIQSQCFENVAAKIDRAGGVIQYGWAIWHLPGLYFEAEHHGVWRNQRGRLVDVSPQINNVKKILFLPDESAKYDRQSFKPNRFTPDGDSYHASRFVELALKRNKIIDSYRAWGRIAPALSPLEQNAISQIESEMLEIARQVLL